MEYLSEWPIWAGGIATILVLVRLYIVNPILLVRDDVKNMAQVRHDIVEIRSELKRNGGSSVKDAVIRVEESQKRTEAGMNEIKTRLDEHIQFHLEDGRGK